MNQAQSETASLSATRCSTKLITEQDATPKLRQELSCHRVGRWQDPQGTDGLIHVVTATIEGPTENLRCRSCSSSTKLLTAPS